MNNGLGSGQSVDGSSVRKPTICERCWLFKRKPNSKHSKGKDIHGQVAIKQTSATVSRFDEHKKFLARLREYQESLPIDEIEQPVIVSQVTPDSSDVKNIFVNNSIRSKGNINLKAIVGSMNQIQKEQPNHNGLESRSLRLNRKCKMTNNIIPDEIDLDDDILLGDLVTSMKTGNKKVSGADGSNRVVADIKVDTVEKSTNPLDELLGEKELPLKSVKPKKRKMESVSNEKKNCTNDIKDMIEQFNRKDIKNLTKKTNVAAQSNFANVIEIDGENTVTKESELEEPLSKQTRINCPMCNKLFSSDEINNHAYTCQGPQPKTRKQNSNKNSQDMSCNYDKEAWDNACKGLADVKQIALAEQCEKTNSVHEIMGSSNIKKSNLSTTDRFQKCKLNSKTNERLNGNDRLTNEQKSVHGKTLDPGCMEFTHGKSPKSLLENYAKTIHKIKGKNPPAKQLRTFGEVSDDENDFIRCAKCDEYIPDDQLKTHTDLCINEESLLIE